MIHTFSRYLGALLLVLNLVSCQRPWQASPSLAETNVPVDKMLSADQTAETLIAPYRQEVTSKMTEVIGTAPAELQKADYQSPLGNFVVDLMLEQAKKVYSGQLDMATTTNGGLRVPIPQGPVNVGNIFELMPFENELVVLTLDGPTTQELFDFAVTSRYAPLANATFTVKGGKATDIKIGGKSFDPAKTYTIVTSDYLAGGGDNMALFKKAIKTEKLGVMLRDVIITHIRELTAKGQPIVADASPRVTVAQ